MSKCLFKHGNSILFGKRLWQSMVMVVFMVMLFTVLLFAFHHHEDEKNHESDCNICSVLHDRLADDLLQPKVISYLPFVFFICLAPLVLIVDFARYYQTQQNRAPPVF